MSASALVSVTNNTHTYTSLFHICNGVSITPLIFPNFAPNNNKKKFNRRLVLVKAQSSSSSVAGFEVDFKPSFDDYLKAMESVKTVRDRRSKARNGGKLGDSEEEGKGSVGGPVRNPIRDKPAKENQRDAVYGENARGEKDDGNNRGSIRDESAKEYERKIVYGKNGRWEKDNGNKRGSTRNRVGDKPFDADERGIVYRKNERWEKDNGNNRGSTRNRVGDKPFDADERGIVYGKNERWEKDNGNNRGSTRNRVGDKPFDADERGTVYGKNERWEKDNGNNRGSTRNRVGDIPFDADERGTVYGKNDRWEKDNNRGSTRNGVRDEPFEVEERKIVYGKNGRWEQNKGNKGGSIRNWVRDESVEVNEGKILHGKDVRWGKDRGDIAVKDRVNVGSIRDSIQDEAKVNGSKFVFKSTRGMNMYGRNVRWEENRGNSSFVKEKDYNFEVDEDRIPDTEVVKTNRRSDVYDRNGSWEENQKKRDREIGNGCSFGVDKDRVRGTQMVLRNEKLSEDNVVFRRRNRAVAEESDGDEEFGFERAAFKSVEGSNDVVDKLRITQREMEERMLKLARCLNGADINIPEWMFSKMMRSARIRFSDRSILRIIQLLGKLGNWKRVLQLIDWLQSRERFKSYKLRYIYTTALGVLGKARRPVEALNLFHTMQQNMSTYPDVVAYHSIAVTLGQAGHMRELFDVIDTMKSPPKKKFRNEILEKWDPRLEPDIIIYNAVLNACVRRKQWEGAFWVLQQLEEKGQQPYGTTYGLVMEVMLACEKYNLVHDFYRKMLKSSIPNVLTYKVLVNTLWREGKTDEAVLAVEDMERRGVVGSAALYYDLARCLCSAGRCQEALVQVNKICRVANKPLVVTYTGLIQACLDAGNIEDGAYIFKHMHRFCFPNTVTCNIMLKAYIENGKFEEAMGLFHKLLEDGNHISSKEDYKNRVIPDKYSFNTMLDACVKEQRWDDFEVVYEGMLQYGFPFNAKRHLRMILDAGRAGKGKLLETTWNHLIQNDQMPPPHPLVKEMLCLKVEQGDYAAALTYISSHRPSNLQPFSCNAWLNFFDENAHRLQKDDILRLVHEVSLLMSRNDAQHVILQNLALACREFLKTKLNASQTDCVETQTVLC